MTELEGYKAIDALRLVVQDFLELEKNIDHSSLLVERAERALLETNWTMTEAFIKSRNS